MPPRDNSSSPKRSRIPLFKGILLLFGLTLVLTAIGVYYLWNNFLESPRLVTELPYEEVETRPAKDLPLPQPLPPKSETEVKPFPDLPKIAIVIDDLGYDRLIAQKFIELPLSLTLSFLPQAPYSKEMARLAMEKGKEILLHLPMEPLDYPQTNPGPGALLISMSEEEIINTLDNDFKEFPLLKGPTIIWVPALLKTGKKWRWSWNP